MGEHELNADEAINRQRFSSVKKALQDGKVCDGTCKAHALLVDSQVLQLEATEATLVDVRNLRVQFSTLSNQVIAYMNRSNAVAGEQIEQHGLVEMIMKKVLEHPDIAYAKTAGGGGTIAWLCKLGIAIAMVAVVWLVTNALRGGQ